MIRTARLLLSTFAMTVLLAGVGAVQSGSAQPPPAATAIQGVSAPAATWTPDGTMLVLVQSIHGVVMYKFRFGGPGEAWSDWLDLGAPTAGLDAATAPAATWAADSSRLDVFVKGGSDGHLHQKTLTGAGWGGWVDLGGVLAKGPSATSASGGRIDVFAVGTDLRLHQKSWLGSSWTDWVAFTPPAAGLGSASSATWANSGRLDVFGVGTDRRLYQKSWLSSVGWTAWVAFDPPDAGLDDLGPGIAWVADGTRLDVVVSGATDGRVYQLAWSPAGWSGWVKLS